jgi:hypothetical protein
MSDSAEPDSMKWFKENFPVEEFLSREISKHVDTIFSKVTPTQQTLPIDLFQMKTPDGFSRLGMRDTAVMFYGALAKVIIETVFKNIQSQIPQNLNQQLEEQARKVMKDYLQEHHPLVLQNYKRCPSCKYENDYKNKFCEECGTKLPEGSS